MSTTGRAVSTSIGWQRGGGAEAVAAAAKMADSNSVAEGCRVEEVELWSCNQVCGWLDSKGWGRHTTFFRRHEK